MAPDLSPSPTIETEKRQSVQSDGSKARSASSCSTVRLSRELPRIGTPASRHITEDSKPPSKNTSFLRIVFDDVCITPDVLDHPYRGGGTDGDPYVCEFIPNDARNPQNWPKGRKWMITFIVSIATFAVSFCSSAYTGAVQEIMAEFQASEEIVTLGLSLFVLGYVIGPLAWGPISELYGRRWPFIGTYVALTVFSAGTCGANNIATLVILRCLAGIFGSSPLTNGGGTVADMFAAEDRGVAMALFAAAPFLGPSVGPIVGGFAGQSIGWRWVMGIMTIFSGVTLILGVFTLPETYGPVILERRAQALSKATGKVFRTRLEVKGQRPTPAEAFKTALSRPWILLFLEPIVLITAVYMAIVYGTLYMMFGAFPIVFQEYRGWSQGIGGLAFIGIMVGMMIGAGLSIPDNTYRYKKADKKAREEGLRQAPPEARLPPAIFGSVLLPVGLFWFAWTNGPSVHWSVSIIASAPFGAGMVLVFLAILNYLIDSYTIYAASVLAANSLLRSLFGTVFPLFTTYMYDNLGIHWASSIPAFLALACTPFPFLFWKYGEQIRLRCKYSRQAAEELEEMLGSDERDDAEQRESKGHDSSDSDMQLTGPASDNRESIVEAVSDKDIEKGL